MEKDVQDAVNMFSRMMTDTTAEKHENEVEIVEMNAWVSFATTYASGDAELDAKHANRMLEEMRKAFDRDAEPTGH